MATLDYIEIPSCAIRLRDSGGIAPAHKIITTLPRPDSLEINRYSTHQTSASSAFTTPMNFIPQIIMGSIPTVPVSGPALETPPMNPRKKIDPEKVTLLSSKDPLSLPIMTNNFKRFVANVGPVFWMQDRIEEIMFWRRGWRRTTSWMALYTFLCSLVYCFTRHLIELMDFRLLSPDDSFNASCHSHWHHSLIISLFFFSRYL